MTKYSEKKFLLSLVTYPGHLGDRYTGLGPQNVAPKKHF